MLLFQTSREIIFYFQHFIQVCFYFLGKKTGGVAPRPLPLLRHCLNTGIWIAFFASQRNIFSCEPPKLFFVIATIKQPNTSRRHIVYFFYSELKKFKTAQPHGLMWRHKIPKELLSFFWLVNLTIRHFVLKNSPIKSLNRSDLFWATLVAYRWAWARPLQWPTSYKGLNSDIFVYLQPTT